MKKNETKYSELVSKNKNILDFINIYKLRSMTNYIPNDKNKNNTEQP